MPRPLAAMFFNQLASFFELVQDIIKMNLLTKFHEDRTINVASRVLTRQNVDAARRMPEKGDHKSSPSMSTLCSGELKS
ncbi:hypothetical protein DPMN_012477 [Dreissena polymorpha]|uniref:Uncharacterized protein n=1 Tax=Dreissena polymorpha TaxID=45954 RepID=A0A9D4N2H0_DREPO|nr:hypothetical protein DPMN_012477 [Dreissena polymorpha]